MDSLPPNESSVLEANEGELDNASGALKNQIAKLIKENEQYKQLNYSLHCKLEVATAMNAEMREAQEALEKTANEHNFVIKAKIHEIEEKHIAEKHDFMSRLSDLEAENANKCEIIENLQLKIQELNKTIQSSQIEAPVIVQDETTNQEEIAELLSQIHAKDYEIQRLENCIQDSNNEIAEIKEILASVKASLHETKEQLEIARDETMALKMQLAEAKEKPASESSRGNSLFAEVEDRRRKMLEQNAALKKGYIEAKRIVSSKDAEIRLLKAEKVELMRRWENDKAESQFCDSNLIAKYKERISELEGKLAEQIERINKMRSEIQPTSDNPYSSFQWMMNLKDKKITELEGKLELNSIQSIVEEERTNKFSRQSRYWRCKATSVEAQLAAIKSYLEANEGTVNCEQVLKIFDNPIEVKPDFEEELDATRPPPKIVEESIITIEQLLAKPSPSEGMRLKVQNESSLNSTDDDEKRSDITISPARCLERKENCQISLQEFKDMWHNDELIDSNECKFEAGKTNGVNQKDSGNGESLDATGESMKRKKSLKFSDDTVDPPVRTLKRQDTPRYSIQMAESYDEPSTESDENNCSDVVETNNNIKLKSALVQNTGKSMDEAKKEKKTLKFTEDTVDPSPKPLKRQSTPKYPIIFVSNKPKKNNN